MIKRDDTLTCEIREEKEDINESGATVKGGKEGRKGTDMEEEKG